jgi:2-methylcitrate dehydratase PrpD
VDAQFSMPFGAAMALLYRDAGLDRFSEENLRSAEVRKLMGRVVLNKDIRIEKNFPREWQGRVTVALANGAEYLEKVRHPKGDPENPLTWDELRAKFHGLCGTGLKPSHLLDSLQVEV